MPTADLPMPAGEPLDSANVSGTAERRVSEQLVTDWEQETRRLGHALALMTLDTSTMSGPKWAHRFIIDVHPTVENSSLVFYGARFASLFGLPEKPDQSARESWIRDEKKTAIFQIKKPINFRLNHVIADREQVADSTLISWRHLPQGGPDQLLKRGMLKKIGISIGTEPGNSGQNRLQNVLVICVALFP